MSSIGMISGVDFVTVPARKFEEATEFYETVLGLPCSKRYRNDIGVKFETGNLTLQVLNIERLGLDLQPSTNPIALHVEDFEGAKAELSSRGVSFEGETLDSGVCWQAFFQGPERQHAGDPSPVRPPDALPAD